jgi:2'-phosphotransferase
MTTEYPEDQEQQEQSFIESINTVATFKVEQHQEEEVIEYIDDVVVVSNSLNTSNNNHTNKNKKKTSKRYKPTSNHNMNTTTASATSSSNTSNERLSNNNCDSTTNTFISSSNNNIIINKSTMNNTATTTNKSQSLFIKLSHLLSLSLRHKAMEYHWPITTDGYVPISILLSHSSYMKYNYTYHDLQHVVKTNDKQRYTIQEKYRSDFIPYNDQCRTYINTLQNNNITSNTNTNSDRSERNETASMNHNRDKSDDTTIVCIRANQGHSIPYIDSNVLLQRLFYKDCFVRPIGDYDSHNDQNSVTRKQMIQMIHGTNDNAYQQIIQSGGLSKMTRNHIHFTTCLPNIQQQNQKQRNQHETEKPTTISGIRKNCTIYIYINIIKCIQDHIPIYKSSNNVLLTDGIDHKGILPIQYFDYVADHHGNILMKN